MLTGPERCTFTWVNSRATSRAERDDGVKSANRVLDIFELLVGAAEGRTLTEIGQGLGIPKSSVHALVSTLARRGYLSYAAATRSYTLGIRLWEAGSVFNFHDELRRQALPLMQRVVDELDEIVQLAVRDGTHNVYLAKVDCRQPIQLVSRVGARLPCHPTGLGKVLLADLSDDELDLLYSTEPLAQFTPRTITSLEVLRHELALVRAQGFAEDREEYAAGLRCVAVPVFGSQHRAVAAVSVSFPAGRASGARLDRARDLLWALADDLSLRLGCRQGGGPDESAERSEWLLPVNRPQPSIPATGTPHTNGRPHALAGLTVTQARPGRRAEASDGAEACPPT